ncbi:MAG: hypothetical protein HY823_05435 [Acidobacteria bacterium]|nr:hypothetical protein [Acidobacteriota bacterium]
MGARIGILTQTEDRWGEAPFLLGHLADRWRERGHQVELATDWERPLACDLAILHLDLTRIPPRAARWAAAHPRVLNGRVLDISKRRFSGQLLAPGDPWEGPVIIKTDLNFGGLPEARLAGCDPQADRWEEVRCLPPDQYPVLPHRSEVPGAVWTNPSLIVERFLPERDEEGRYALRCWVFFGEEGIVWRSLSNHPLVKAGNAFHTEALEEVPPEVWKLRRDLGLDFGKIDFGMVGGRAVVYDVNKTPTQSRVTERSAPFLDRMAGALEAYLAGTPAP